MNAKKLMLLTAVISSLGGLYGCSEGDEATVTIDSDTTNNSGGSGSSDVSENCPTWASARNKDSNGNDVCALPSQILQNRTLTSDIVWFMDGRVTVGNGNGEMSATQGELESGAAVADVTLTIQEGTSIKARTGTFANLLITRGSKIQAVGTAAAPIVFSSDDEGEDGTGEWGGLIIHGYGDHNECIALPCNVDAEGESGFAGGVGRSDDNSGRLSYVIVTEGGWEFAPGNEINGISLVAVGSGTQIDHIQVNSNADDGIEFYGGDVNVKYMVLTGNLDDSVDWDEGYQGNIQYVIVKQVPASFGTAIEADTEGTTAFLSKPTIANATFIGDGTNSRIHQMKSSSGGFIHNSIMTVASGNTSITACVFVNGSGAEGNRNMSLAYNNVIADCTDFETINDPAGGSDPDPIPDNGLTTTTVFSVAANLDANYASQAAEAQLAAPIDWTAINGTYPESVADTTYLDATDYLGAVDPDATTPWYEGWILDGTL